MPKQTKEKALIPREKIEQKIFLIRGKKVMLDKDLAELYCVTTGNLNKAVKRNIDRFPDDFMFQLNKAETDSLRFQSGTLKRGEHSKYLPFAFTEQCVAMLSSVLTSKIAVQVNIQIIRVFTKLREMIISNKELRQRLEEMERKYDTKFQVIFTALRKILEPKEEPQHQIGFDTEV